MLWFLNSSHVYSQIPTIMGPFTAFAVAIHCGGRNSRPEKNLGNIVFWRETCESGTGMAGPCAPFCRAILPLLLLSSAAAFSISP